MSKRRNLQQQLDQLDDIKSIMEAMKNLAVVETHKLDRLLENQQQIIRDLEEAAAGFLAFYPYSPAADNSDAEIWLLFGSERGFCGDYNEALIKFLDEHLPVKDGKVLLIPVGNKLCMRLEDDPRAVNFVNGPDVVEELMPVLNTIIEHINSLQLQHTAITVNALYHHARTRQIIHTQLIPPFSGYSAPEKINSAPTLLNLKPDDFYPQLVEHYLLISMHEICCMSLLAENYQRVEHMTGAIDRLDKKSANLTRKYHVFHQEEITEELEVILLNSMS